MQQASRGFVCSTLFLLAGAPACITGLVKDADTGSPVEGVTVTAQGACAGDGCQSPTQGRETSAADGRYIFDAYAQTSDKQWLTPAQGQEAVSLSLSKSGYQSAQLLLHPNYQKLHAEDGTEFLVASAQDVFLCTTGAADSDNDGLCNAAEAKYGTDPTLRDSDLDGFSDRAELLGFNGVDLKYFGASPNHRDGARRSPLPTAT